MVYKINYFYKEISKITKNTKVKQQSGMLYETVIVKPHSLDT